MYVLHLLYSVMFNLSGRLVIAVLIYNDFSSSATGGPSCEITEEGSKICIWRTVGTSANKVLPLIFKPGWLGS
jgi:hypothetical protein